MKRALTTGIAVQDGAYLAEFLLEKDYEVHGIKRRSSLLSANRTDHLYQQMYTRDQKFALHYGAVPDSSRVPDSSSLFHSRSGSYLGSGHVCIFAYCRQTVVSFSEGGGKST